jgi:hypothetical protein
MSKGHQMRWVQAGGRHPAERTSKARRTARDVMRERRVDSVE